MGFVLGLGSLHDSVQHENYLIRITAMASVVVFNLPFWLVALAEKAWHEQSCLQQGPTQVPLPPMSRPRCNLVLTLERRNSGSINRLGGYTRRMMCGGMWGMQKTHLS